MKFKMSSLFFIDAKNYEKKSCFVPVRSLLSFPSTEFDLERWDLALLGRTRLFAKKWFNN